MLKTFKRLAILYDPRGYLMTPIFFIFCPAVKISNGIALNFLAHIWDAVVVYVLHTWPIRAIQSVTLKWYNLLYLAA